MQFLAQVMVRFVIVLNSFLLIPTTSFAIPANLGLLRQEVKVYHDSQRYAHDLEKRIKQARVYINQQIAENKHSKTPHKLALVLDIDETSITNYDKLAKRDFIGTREQIHHEIIRANSPAIAPMLALYKEALNHGVNIFFVTGRTESQRNATRLNLRRAGYSNWSGIYLRPDVYNLNSIVPFKSQARASIAKKGYTIIASIGDQYSDIKGGYAQKGFKLPNPFYYLP